jgi:hypothetical protein
MSFYMLYFFLFLVFACEYYHGAIGMSYGRLIPVLHAHAYRKRVFSKPYQQSNRYKSSSDSCRCYMLTHTKNGVF